MKVVVFSYDGYSHVLPFFLHFYRKNWADNPYPTEIVTEVDDVPGMTVYKTGKLPWATRMLKYLSDLKEEKFLLLISDYILDKPTNTGWIKRAEALCNDDIGCVRIHERNHQSIHLVNTGIAGYKEYPLDKPYSISLMTSIWQKEFFMEFLKEGENIWQCETEGSKRIINSKKKVLWADEPCISHHPHGYMAKGKVVESVADFVKENW